MSTGPCYSGQKQKLEGLLFNFNPREEGQQEMRCCVEGLVSAAEWAQTQDEDISVTSDSLECVCLAISNEME
ncbi:hypothetical protein NDU88_005514 [Pleurodeles waltl]|uniref:RNase H type-1 domain-containing protein n=1 Tax=Pleurodeles waltl TaxID=8319 RepID=A0AAV7MEU5_PLEWA|nr:hypothetical protein NDU88_005514 [Pleurodeles waltl]